MTPDYLTRLRGHTQIRDVDIVIIKIGCPAESNGIAKLIITLNLY